MDGEKPEEDRRPLPSGCWVRSSEGLEFARVVTFTDAIFAIALTLLIFKVTVPTLGGDTSDPQTMLKTLSDKAPEVAGFFIVFILVGRYWMSHHIFLSHLRAVDRRFVGINLLYLVVIAFLPFPTELLVKYEENPISVLTVALCLSIASGIEAVQFHRAYRLDLFIEPLPREVYGHLLAASLIPIAVFAVTSPIAFVSCNLTLATWLIIAPLERYLNRRAPEGAAQYRATRRGSKRTVPPMPGDPPF